MQDDSKTLRTLLIGDIVGEPGEKLLCDSLPSIKSERQIDFVIANAENIDVTGSGIRQNSLDNLLSAGVDVVTGGDHLGKKRDQKEFLVEGKRLLRPLNYSSMHGKGSIVCSLSRDAKTPIGVINLLGNVFMEKTKSAFPLLEEEVKKIKLFTKIIFVDFHAEATSEKVAMGWFLDGLVSGVVGTHTHVQTADERILPQGTAYITDLGMTGGHFGVIGRKKDSVLSKFMNRFHRRFEVATEDLRINGVIVDVDLKTGKALKIERFAYFFEK